MDRDAWHWVGVGLVAWLASACSLDRSGLATVPDERDGGVSPIDASSDRTTLPDVLTPDLAVDAEPPFDATPPDLGSDATALDASEEDAAALDADGADVLDATPADTAPTDAEPVDAEPVDAGPPDLGPMDAGPPDLGPMDAGPPDLGPSDAGPPDLGPIDMGPPDACGLLSPPGTVYRADDRGALESGARTYVVVEDPGQLELDRDRYRYGGLLGIGYGRELVDSDYSFAEVAAGTPTGARLVDDLDVSYSALAAPPFLNLPGDGYTLELRGEIRLTAGTWTFELDADDRAILAIDAGSDSIEMRNIYSDPPSTATLVVGADGWYPIRAAYSDFLANSGFRVRAARAGTSLAVVAPAMLRFDASNLTGREMHGWDAVVPTALPDGYRYDAEPTEVSWGTSRPNELGIGNGDDWSVRWAGRLLFGASDAMLTVTSDDVHRVWIDGLCYGGAYDGGSTSSTYATFVPAGWHDVILELTERGGDASMTATLGGVRFEAPSMRVATRFGGHVATRLARGPFTFASGSIAHADIDIDESRAALVAAEVSVMFDATPTIRGIDVTATAPGGATRTWPAGLNAVGMGIGRYGFRAVWTGAGLPTDADGRWEIDVGGAGTETGTVTTAAIVAHSGGVAAPYATIGTWESPALDLGGLVRLGTIALGFDSRFGTRVQPEVRWSSTAAGLTAAPWTAIDPSTLSIPGGPYAAFVQIRLVLTGDGTETPRVRSVALDGSRCMP